MSKPRTISIIRPVKGQAERRQRDACEEAGATVHYVIGTDCQSWRDAIRSVRRGDVVAVMHLALLPDAKTRKLIPSQDMRDALEAIERRGGSLVEAATGRRSSVASERAAMIADAARSLGSGGRSLSSEQARANGAKAGASRGRPAARFSDADMVRARAAWDSRKLATWADVAEALPEGFSVDRAYKLWGPRGGRK